MASSITKDIARQIPGAIIEYTDGTVQRLIASPIVPPSPTTPDPDTGVLSKDITISQTPPISARLYLPSNLKYQQKLPILVYFHGGGFCLESAFSSLNHRYINLLASEAQAVCVSVEYRLVPEHPLPAAYEDCWDALKFVAAHHHQLVESDGGIGNYMEPWIVDHGDFDRIFVGGDSAGANAAHSVAIRAGIESLPGNVKVFGAFLAHPYFWSSKPVGNESLENHDKLIPRVIWDFVYPSAVNGIDNHLINPIGPGASCLSTLGCSKLLVCIAGKDFLRERGVWYHQLVKESGWGGELEELFEVNGEEHSFHVGDPETKNARTMITRLASFIKVNK